MVCLPRLYRLVGRRDHTDERSCDGAGHGGILAFLIGAFFGGLLCRSLLQRGADYRPALAVLGVLAVVCMAGGIFLICFDRKRKAADIDRERG